MTHTYTCESSLFLTYKCVAASILHVLGKACFNRMKYICIVLLLLTRPKCYIIVLFVLGT